MAEPDVITPGAKWRKNAGQDPAKYLVDPGAPSQDSSGNWSVSPGGLYHARPYLLSGDNIFVFPVGVEGFTRSGTATLGLHHYIGDNSVDGVTIHFEEARIDLSGTFPGITAQDNMVDCINILRSKPSDPGITLNAPGVFDNVQYVLPENWNFTHDPDDRSHSIQYTISLVRIGEGRAAADKKGGTAPPPAPSKSTTNKGKPSRIFTVKAGAQTFRQIAKIVYNDVDKWQTLVQLNSGQLHKWTNQAPIPAMSLPTYRWPIGTKFAY